MKKTPPADVEVPATVPAVVTPVEMVPIRDGTVTTFERLLRDQTVDVDKMERFLAMHERIEANRAKIAFDTAFAALQGELPVMGKDGGVDFVNKAGGRTNYRFTTNAALQSAIKPIMQKHGFSLRFQNSEAAVGWKMVAVLSHAAGHSVTDEFVAPADHTGNKNDIQAIGSVRSYGQRYLTLSILNIATGEDDDSQSAYAERSAKRQTPPPPRREDDSHPDDDAYTPPPRRTPPPMRQPSPTDQTVISDKQLARLHAIAKTAGRKPEAMKAWLAARYGLASSKLILRSQYEEIVTAVEAKGPLPLGARPTQEREAGGDDE